MNLGIKGVVTKGDHVIISSMEHNSVTRPLKHLEHKGVIELSIVKCSRETGKLTVNDMEQKIKDNTRLILLTHASNVTGTLMPIEEVGELAAKEDIIFMVDAAQTAGVYPIDVQKLKIDLLAFPGHKGLLGPQGTGGLYITQKLSLKSLRQGGTGSDSEALYQPQEIPDKYESGTPNGVGIAGLGAGIEYIKEEGMENLRNHKLELTNYLLTELGKMSGVKIYGPRNIKEQAPVISINLTDKMASEVGFMLDRAFDIGIRAGLHCAPSAHRTLNTLEQGTVRISPGTFNNQVDCNRLIQAVKDIFQQIN